MTLYELPVSYDPDDNKSVAIPKALIPLVAGRLRALEYSNAWREDDQVVGPQAIYLLQERLGPKVFFGEGILGQATHTWDGRNPLYMWRDLAKTQQVTAAGQEVAVWQSVQGLDAVRQTATGATWNGTNGLVFSGAQYYDVSIARTESETILIVSDRSSTANKETLVTSNIIQNRVFWDNNAILYTGMGAAAITTPAPTSACVICHVLSAATNVLRHNGSETTATPGTASRGVNLRIGFRDEYSSAVAYYSGVISHLSLFTRALDLAEREKAEAEAAALYGVTW